MKLATKLTILVSLGFLMGLLLMGIVYLFNARINSSMEMALNLNDANESILTAIIEEKKLLNDETNADMSVVNEQLGVASDLIAVLESTHIFTENEITFASLYDLLKKYRTRFNELTETLRKFDEETDTLNQNLYEYSQKALSVLQNIRMEIGMAMINAEEVDETIRSFSEVVKNLLLWSRQVNLVFNQDLFVKKNEEQFRENMVNTFKQLELEKKNALLLKSYIQDNDYVDFINASIVLVDELPGRADSIHVLWNRKNDLAARLDTLRKNLLIQKNHILFQAKQDISQLYKNQSLWLIASFLAILIVYIAAGLRVSRSISHPLNRIIRGVDNISRQTAVAASQFTNSSQNLAQNAAEQASSIEEITATLEQLSAMSHETTKLTQGADELMNQNIIKSGQSLKSFVELTRKMKQVEADSDKIDQIISDIDGIAFQTNLLALNAAVEAARAGEAGSGFGVVAEEVRNLAKKTAEAAQNTQNLLRGTVTGISEAVKTIQTINSDFEGIIESATVMGEKTEAITSASKEQSLGIEQITISAGEIDQSTQQIAASSQQSASASEELNSQARQMNQYVIELSTLIRGKTESPEKPKTNKGATGFVQARTASTRVNR